MAHCHMTRPSPEVGRNGPCRPGRIRASRLRPAASTFVASRPLRTSVGGKGIRACTRAAKSPTRGDSRARVSVQARRQFSVASCSRRRYRARDERRQAGTNAVPQRFVDHIAERAAGQAAVAERRARDVPAADAGKMHDDLAGVGIAEYPPRIAFIGNAVIGVEAKPVLAQDLRRAMELRELLIRPAARTTCACLRRGSSSRHWNTPPAPLYVFIVASGSLNKSRPRFFRPACLKRLLCFFAGYVGNATGLGRGSTVVLASRFIMTHSEGGRSARFHRARRSRKCEHPLRAMPAAATTARCRRSPPRRALE